MIYKACVALVLMVMMNLPVMADDIKASGCVISTKSGIVWVQDGWTRKLSLPGGMRKNGESPEQNAIRETYEETGLAVEIIKPLGIYKAFQIYECRAKAVPVIGKVIGRKLGKTPYYRLNTENALHNGTEILGAWITGTDSDSTIYRFKNQLAFIQSLKTTVISPIKHEAIVVGTIYKADLAIIKWIQGYKTKGLDLVFEIFNALGTDKVFFVLLPFLFLLRSRLGDIQHIIYITILSVVINGLLKVGFAMPRPLFVDPTVQHIKTAYGFGFPSGHTQVATTFWLSIAVWFARRWFWWALFVGMGIMTGLARMYFGVHFAVDVIGAWILSTLIVYGGIRMGRPVTKHWIMLLLFTVPVMLYTESLDTLSISMVGLGIFLVVWRMRILDVKDYNKLQRCMYSVIGVLLVFGISGILSWVKGSINSGGGIIFISAVSYFMIGIILQTLPYGIKKVICQR